MSDEYSSGKKDLLTLREAVIKRPGMYFGDMERDGANSPVFELLANAIDQFLAGHAKEIILKVDGNFISVTDDGAGFGFKERTELENFLIYHHNSPTADNHAPHIHVEKGGLGLAYLNAASKLFKVETCDGKTKWSQEFKEGNKINSNKMEAIGTPKGSTISLTLDEKVFGKNTPNLLKIRKVIFETIHLYQGISVRLNDESFISHNGLLDFGYLLAKPNCHTTNIKEFTYDTIKEGVSFQAVAIGTSEEETQFHSWVNGSRTVENGSHVNGFKKALSAVNWNPEIALIHTIMHEPKYAGPCKDKLINNKIERIIANELSKNIK